jgi:RNase P/RNase MRP subunit p29
MNLIGKEITVVGATDPTKKGIRGKVVLETSKTLLLDSDRGRVRLEKRGSMMLLSPGNKEIIGDELLGRLEDRLRRRQD